MKVEPHIPVDLKQESILCEPHQVVTPDGSTTPVGDLEKGSSPFVRFLKTLDPNKCFVVAFADIENKQARDMFYAAQRAARNVGIHMQGTVAPYDEQLASWDRYKTVRRLEDKT